MSGKANFNNENIRIWDDRINAEEGLNYLQGILLVHKG